MRLKSIKLAGFKSFVDPATVNLPCNLTAVVGPNGCGKSNVIDAVRWVMGESSAKHLRGESMADVIFNGSTSRKPVSQASIELVFDNTENRLLGEYAQYNEIAIRRLVTRDGQSSYYFNGTKCRRKDITDLFLGTGLGPRSYAIIEQGMISRLIEAKPEELRIFIEEAAGISKYKERRRETENRIRRSRENLERLEDLREELGRQLQHLQRQAQSAEKYTQFKAEERLYTAQLQALQWQGLDQRVGSKAENIRDLELKVEMLVTERVNCESEIEQRRESHQMATELFNDVQGKYYDVGNDITRVETNLQNLKERQAQLRADLEQTQASFEAAQQEQTADAEKLEEFNAQLMELEPELELALASQEESSEALEQAEEKMRVWQVEWDEFNQHAAEPTQQAQVQQSKIQHLEQSLQRLRERVQRLALEADSLSTGPMEKEAEELRAKLSEQEEQLAIEQESVDTIVVGIGEQREENSQNASQLDKLRSETQTLIGRKASLEALQQAALGQGTNSVASWLDSKQLGDNPRLGEELKVTDGWEAAVEAVLGNNLQAVCTSGLDPFSDLGDSFNSGSMTLLEPASADSSVSTGTPLLNYVESYQHVGGLLNGVIAVEDLSSALRLRSQLKAGESVVTKAGIWLGRNWLRVVKDEDAQAGVIQRQKELEDITERLALDEEKVEQLNDVLTAGRGNLGQLEQHREQAQKNLGEANRALGEMKSQLSAKEERLEQIAMRRERTLRESTECKEQIEVEQEELGEARVLLQTAIDTMENDSNKRERLTNEREENRQALDQAKQQARTDKDRAHEFQLRNQSLQSSTNSIKTALARLSGQLSSYQERLDNLHGQSGDAEEDSSQKLQSSLDELLVTRVQAEEELSQARSKLEVIDQEMQSFEKRRHKADEDVQTVREQLTNQRMDSRGFEVERDSLRKQIESEEYTIETLINELPEEANEDDWRQYLEKLAARINRLGAINLAAIDEYKAQHERKVYLDAQNDDLMEALDTLENAIRKIDRETRTRFKETFDKINRGLQELFPKVFGGGHAYLELTGEDLLDTGVAIMARPPGKRNSTIHLLSGGEKALTAIALVFSIFQLNPAPFCMLDEVDAPLDDANVGRYSRLVKEMSAKVQFIFITHNKITMEIADQLMGVTMHEPGCSRLVSVDVEEAAALAAV